MPCYDNRDRISTPGRRMAFNDSGLSPSEMLMATDRINWLEAALCAVFNELERRGVASSVAAEASRSGLIGIIDFWNEHQKSDESRIAAALHGFSKDEQAIIKRILNTK